MTDWGVAESKSQNMTLSFSQIIQTYLENLLSELCAESDLEGKVGGQDGLVLEEEQQVGADLQGDLHQVEAVQATPKGILQQK